MSTLKTARQRARAEITGEIVAEARRQLATDGASNLSLRSVARELGMASSAIYRYFASRDELLTALIIESYDALGETAEHAASSGGTSFDRWIATTSAIRGWALDHPHEYALVFGTPVPGYAAPDTTSEAGTRASRALVGIVAEAWRTGELTIVDDSTSGSLSESLAGELAALAAELDFDGPPLVLLAVLAAWTQMYGLITFELFGQTRNVVHDHAGLFAATTELMARRIGLHP